MSYSVSENSVITSVFTPNSNNSFLTCGGTNIAPKAGETWANFQVTPTGGSTTNFKYIFNCNLYVSGKTEPTICGLQTATPDPNTIKQFLYDNGIIEYVCGQFSFSGTPTTATNIMYFNPVANTTTTGYSTFNNLSNIAFAGGTTAVNCMAFLNLETNQDADNTTKLVIAGTFTQATISSVNSFANIALLNVSTAPSWTINNSIISDATINSASTIINSIIVINNVIYVGGVNGINCIFYSYNTISNTWTNLLASATYTGGSINILKRADNYIAIGGSFSSLGTALNCNNIVLYTISNGSWTALGTGVTKGVTVIPSNANYPSLQVFALDYLKSRTELWVGGYFTNAGDELVNSLAMYNISNSSWNVIVRNGDNGSPTTKGLLNFNTGTDPGVVYSLNINAIDTSVIMVGGSFRTSTTSVALTFSQNIYNLVKITTATTNGTKRNYTKFNSKSQ